MSVYNLIKKGISEFKEEGPVMKTSEKIIHPQYLQIAQDLAARISKGEIAEGSRLYGRSLMSSEYKVSPETIRRALRLLADMKVVDTKPQSGTIVLSQDSARRYLEHFSETTDMRALQEEVKQLLDQFNSLQRKFVKVMEAVTENRNTFAPANDPLPHYEVAVPQDSNLLGRSLVELKFWQSTGGTIVAIRRGPTLILSPGPYAELYAGDVLVLVGSPAAALAAQKLVRGKKRGKPKSK